MKATNINEIPSYGFMEAAHYLRIPRSRLKSWFEGSSFGSRGKTEWFKPIFQLPKSNKKLLSFMNLLEVHVLVGLRNYHKFSLQHVRRVIIYVKKRYPSNHPLINNKFQTDGVNLFVARYGELINASHSGQREMKILLQANLSRIDRDNKGLPTRLNLYIRKQDLNEPNIVVIDPKISFGRPSLRGTNIPTAVIGDRYKAGETIKELAADYGKTAIEIEEAIRCELPLQVA